MGLFGAHARHGPEKYLSKLIIPLRGSRLVTSTRGFNGGYALARHPSQINLRQILEVLEGDLAPVECVREGMACARSEVCPTRHVWIELFGLITGFFENMTLEELVRRHGGDSPDYCI